MIEIAIGQTDYTKTVFIPDPASTDGSGKTGLVAANLTVSYTRVETDNDVTVTDATSSLNNLATLTAAHNDWGVLEVSSTLAPGLYRLDIADAVFTTGAWTAVVYVMITTSAAAASPIEFTLTSAAGGTVNANVVSMADDVITAASIAPDAVGASELSSGAADEIADALLDRANGVEAGLTPRNALRLLSAAMAGKLSGAGSGTEVIRNAIADSKNRISATVDSSGNRSAVTTDLT